MAINIGAVSIYQDIELSLTEHMVSPVVHVKQFDHKSRKVRCAQTVIPITAAFVSAAKTN